LDFFTGFFFENFLEIFLKTFGVFFKNQNYDKKPGDFRKNSRSFFSMRIVSQVRIFFKIHTLRITQAKNLFFFL